MTFHVAFRREIDVSEIISGIFIFREFFNMTKKDRAYVDYCIEKDPHIFYSWCKWLQVREKVLKSDKFECVICREKYHRYRAANTVHHVNHLKDRPDLALSTHYIDPATHQRKRQLISLCHDCHEEVHGWRCKDGVAKEPLTEERWD